MKTLALLISCVAVAAIAPSASAYPYHGHYRGYVYVAPYYPRYAYPYWYVVPFVATPYYYVPAPAPVVVEPRYPQARAPQPREPQYREGERSERSYAMITPKQPQPAQLERYTLSAKELFDFDKATLHMPQPKLDEIAEALATNPSIGHVAITGYTDRIGSNEYNLKLSQRRAAAVKDYLVKKGVAAGRLEAIGKGEANPVVHCDDENREQLIKCLEPNRRVEVEQITIEVKR